MSAEVTRITSFFSYVFCPRSSAVLGVHYSSGLVCCVKPWDTDEVTKCVRQTGDDGWNSHKDGHHNKSSLRQATRLSRALATSQTASPLFSVSSFSVACSRPHSVSSSYGFCSLRAVLKTHRGGSGGEKKRRSRNKRQKLAPCGRGCSVQPVMMSGKKCKAADGSAHARWMLYLQVFIAGGEQMSTLYTLYRNAHHSHLVGIFLCYTWL